MHISTPAKLVAALVLPLLLAACFFIPGKFTSSMDVAKDGKFSFAYKGEIVAISSDKATAGLGDKVDETFEASCTTDEDEARDCTAKEMAEQRKEWDAGAADRAKAKADEAKEKGEAMIAMMGFNPKDPKTIDAFTAKLMKQKGWRSVVHKGDGVFEVDYAISGTLDRDFVFPLIPDVALSPPMVIARVRNDNSVAIEAPGFGNKDMDGKSMMMAGAPGGLGKGTQGGPDGSFTLSTNGEILTNNTDNGPSADAAKAGWRSMTWAVNPQSKKAPEALIRFGK